MEHTKNFEIIKFYYSKGYFTLNMLWHVVNKAGGITEDEYFELTGCKYPSKEPEKKENGVD